jgi:hypothetical protein
MPSDARSEQSIPRAACTESLLLRVRAWLLPCCACAACPIAA